MAHAKHPGTSARPVSGWRVFSWQLYDFADTIYSMNVVTLYFGLFLGARFNLDSESFGWALTIANLVVAVASPMLGAMSDISQRRLPFLRLFAILTALFTAAIGYMSSYQSAVLFFVLSYTTYNVAANFYQALLPGITNEQNVSRVSAMGVAVGYMGTLVGLGALQFLVGNDESKYPLAFIYTAILFLLFAIPCLTFVPDFAPPTTKVRLSVAGAYRRIADTFTNARQYPGLFRFLIADFIYENAIQAVIGFMAVYASATVGIQQSDLINFLLFSTLFSIGVGLVYGRVVDKIGPKKAIIYTLLLWAVILPAVAAVQTPLHITIIGPFAGMGLAMVWISSRPMLIALTPVAKSGEFFGLYSLSGKSAGVIGVLAWTATLSLLKDHIGEVSSLRTAVMVMWVFILIGLWQVTKLPDARPTRENMLQR